ncbi:MAG: hypothetical protein ACXITV_05395 [Luteibaculaceae bacterium]
MIRFLNDGPKVFNYGHKSPITPKNEFSSGMVQPLKNKKGRAVF